MSTKEKLASLNDVKVTPFPVPEWEEAGKGLHLRSLKGKEWTSVLLKIVECEKQSRGLDANIWICLYCLSEPDGTRVFSDDDFPILAEKNGATLSWIASNASVFAGLKGDSEAKKSSKKNPG
ncbi:hypothetical protein J8F10_19425 [Gemmata sp. G18]|uniref:Phage tail protein n=1 Tax=Gemmata palustris TaxID=2822762 RepID=A0ABS5BUM1_9BACT|nr:hypothetical protein [Gemmata palustris]MBP3957423.1 hypothetical protein [Gemmata palustris]